jgi:DNA-binding cell septation regulator SpoVG
MKEMRLKGKGGGIQMEMTKIQVHRLSPPRGRLVGIASVVFDDSLIVREIKVKKRNSGELYIVYPTNMAPSSGTKYSVVHPLSNELRNSVSKAVIDTYYKST